MRIEEQSTARKRNVLLVGGSRGDGAALVRAFAREGDNVRFTYAGSIQAAEALAGEVRLRGRRVETRRSRPERRPLARLRMCDSCAAKSCHGFLFPGGHSPD
jgi:NAD(P)-dependent dehydrogenase (short-subunit alcohol dehydrogenase family)